LEHDFFVAGFDADSELFSLINFHLFGCVW
jgi:hypothetical protein